MRRETGAATIDGDTEAEALMDDQERPVLICYDGSDGARGAIPAAASLLLERHAVLLDVGPPLTAAESTVVTVSPYAPDFVPENEEVAHERARSGLEQAREAGFEATADAEVAAPTWQGIVDYANEIDAAVIVVGSHGRNAAGELLHGSVSHQIAEHAGRPVLVVPPPRG